MLHAGYKTVNVSTWNRCRRSTSYTKAEIIGHHFSIFLPQENRKEHRFLRELEIATEKGRYEEERWRVKKDGSRYWANFISTPVFTDEKDHIVYFNTSDIE